MKKILVIIGCLLLVGCGMNKTRGLIMEINLDSLDTGVWRCQSDNQEIIKVTEENFIEDNDIELRGQYQFKFVGTGLGSTTITCDYMLADEVIDTNRFYVEVDENNFIKYIKKDGNMIDEISDPMFR